MWKIIAAVVMLMGSILPGLGQGAKSSVVAESDIATLKPGEFLWEPGLAPQGPMTILVNLGVQRAYVYRNGVRIGASTISSGKAGYETPTGVFTILQKDIHHRSKKYNNAPMPYTQRLTWSGIALHAGGLPGYPSSHGCIHLPMAFSKALFQETAMGMTVIVTSTPPAPQTILAPDILHAPAFGSPAPMTGEAFSWTPEKSPSGPLTVLVSAADQRVLVLRNGLVIGRSQVEIPSGIIAGTHALQMLGRDGAGVPQWFYIGLPGHEAGKGKPLDRRKLEAVHVPQAFLDGVRKVLSAGATMLVTEEGFSQGGAGQKLTILNSVS